MGNSEYILKLEKENQALVKQLECLVRFRELESENYHLKENITYLNRNLEDLVEKIRTQDKTIDYLEAVIKNPPRCEEYRMRSNYLDSQKKYIDKAVNEVYIPSMMSLGEWDK